MALRLYYCDHYPIPLPPEHKFPVQKYRLLRETLEADGRFELLPAPLASSDTIALVHIRDYVEGFAQGTLPAAVMRRIGFPWSDGLVQRTLASVGGTLAAATHALDAGLSGGLAGGTHHAFSSEGAGFCVFNDIAIAIASLRSSGKIGRAAILDLDVHQGDGTAAIFAGDPAVFTVSVHGKNNFPFRKQRSSIDVDLEDRTGDDAYLEAIPPLIQKVIDFTPAIVFYQAGVDALAGDRLGLLALTHSGLLQRDRLVLQRLRAAGLPCVITLGGGYCDPIQQTVEAHANTFRAAAEFYIFTEYTAKS